MQEAIRIKNDVFDGLSIRRRLDDMTHAEMIHARGLKEQAHRQLEQVRGSLLHAKRDHARGADGAKERLLLDVNRRLKKHFAGRKLAARRRLQGGVSLADELITISSLDVSISFNLNSRLLIESQREEGFLLPLVQFEDEGEDGVELPNDLIAGWPEYAPALFAIKLKKSFTVDLSLEVSLEVDFKALLHIVVNRMTVDFDLSTNAGGERAVLSEGDWTYISTHVRSGQMPA